MSGVHVVVPDTVEDPHRPSGGNVYDRRLSEALGRLGWSVRVHPMPGPWPEGSGRARFALARKLEALPTGGVVVVDGLVGSGAPEVLVPASYRLRLVALVHMPLGSVDAEPAHAVRVRERERTVLECCAAVVATSHWSRRWLLDQYGLRSSSVVVAEPGVDPAAPAEGTTSRGSLLCVGAVTPLKGHDVLVDALAGIRDLAWTCTCVGSTTVDPCFARKLAWAARLHGIGERVHFCGPLAGEQLDAAYAAADLLVLPSRAESYGMVVTEALGRALPVIASDVGGVSEALSGRARLEPGILVRPDDPAALASALRRWLTDPRLGVELRRRARARRAHLVSWSTTAAQVAQVLTAAAAVPAEGRR